MNRPTEHISYGPGKFEGESCIARFAYNQMLMGFSEYSCECEPDESETQEECLCRGTDHVKGPFTQADVDSFEHDAQDQVCQECLTYLLTLDHVDITESEQGFVYASA